MKEYAAGWVEIATIVLLALYGLGVLVVCFVVNSHLGFRRLQSFSSFDSNAVPYASVTHEEPEHTVHGRRNSRSESMTAAEHSERWFSSKIPPPPPPPPKQTPPHSMSPNKKLAPTPPPRHSLGFYEELKKAQTSPSDLRPVEPWLAKLRGQNTGNHKTSGNALIEARVLV
jgi:hypothetical protein